MDKWMFVLKNMARLLDRPKALQERIFKKLFEAAQIAAMPHEEQVLYRDNMMTENDYRNCIDFAREEGHASGFAEGKSETLVSVAKSMKAMNLPIETIMQATGLALSEIEAL